jgi:hypothetical protein
MTSPRFVFGILVGVVSLASLGGTRHLSAGTITQTFTEPSQTVPYSFMAAASQFNPTNGVLNSVVITVTSNVVGSVEVINILGTPEAFTNATSSVPISLVGPAGLSLDVTATTPSQSGTILGATEPGTNYALLELPADPTTASASTTLTTGLAPYIGTGTHDLAFTFAAGSGTYGGSAPFGVFFGRTAAAAAKITIVYDFTANAIPEPSTLVLSGIAAIAGLGSCARRRRLA